MHLEDVLMATSKSLNAKNVIQFRSDDELSGRLQATADRLHIPVSSLIRAWILDRLNQEASKQINRVLSWREKRLLSLEKQWQSYDPDGVIQLIYLLPLEEKMDLHPSEIQRRQGLLSPVEGTGEYIGRFNLDGYQTRKVFTLAKEEFLQATLQVFTTGQVESIRVLPKLNTESGPALFGPQLDLDLVSAVQNYALILRELRVSLPILISIGFKRIRDYAIRTKTLNNLNRITTFQDDDFFLPDLVVESWSDVEKFDSCSTFLKPAINKLWNGAGLSQSSSYTNNGAWNNNLDTGRR